MLRDLGEVLHIDFVVSTVTVDPTKYVINLYTKRNIFLERKVNEFSPDIININYTDISLYFVY